MTKVTFLLLAAVFWACTPEKKPEQKAATPPLDLQKSQTCQTHVNLNALPTISPPYLPFEKKDKVKTYSNASGSFGVYFDNAAFDFKAGTDRCWINYQLKPEPYGEWISIRKQFAKPFDASGCTGLKLTVKVEKPSANARLRLTVCDVDGSGKDEMWWFDFDTELLQNVSSGVEKTIPFSMLELAWEHGTRENDGKPDWSKIIAYEISIFSPSMERANGVLSFTEPLVY